MVVIKETSEYVLTKGTGKHSTLYNVIEKSGAKRQSPWFGAGVKRGLLSLGEKEFNQNCKALIENGQS